jgi:hypothetical protein
MRLRLAPTAPPRTAATRRSLQLADAGEGAVDRPEPGVHLGVRRVAPGRLQRAAVGAELLAGRHQLLGHRDREGIAPLGCVQAQDRDATVTPLD